MSIAVVPQRTVSAADQAEELIENGLVTAAIWNSDDPHSDLSDISIVHQGVKICDLPGLTGAASADVRCALHLDSPPRSRRRTISMLRSVDGLTEVIGIDRPIAAFANSWHQNPHRDPSRPLHIVVTSRRTGGALVVGHTDQRRLVAVGVFDGPDRIRTITETAARFSQRPLSIDVPMRWSSTLSRVGAVVTYALSSSVRAEIDELFGSLVLHHDSDGVLPGLTRMRSLRSWSACWPTTRIHLGPGWTRQPGPLRGRVEEHLARLRAGAEIGFADSCGRPLPVRAGSISARGCVIPEWLGTQPRLRLLDDGRLILLGSPQSRALAMEVAWPIPASGREYVEVRAAGPTGIQLTDSFEATAVGVG
ncbi:MAG: hypothetical protein ACN4GZ_16695 [Acidimicrobiales bacterium]